MQQGNSDTEKKHNSDDANKPTCIVKGNVAPQKKTAGTKLKEFFKNDTGESVLHDIYEDVIKPGIIDLIYDMGVGALSSLCYHDGGRRKRKGSGSSYEKTDYTKASSSRESRRERRRSVLDTEYTFEDYNDAADVRAAIIDRCQHFGTTTVDDYYDYIGVSNPGQYCGADWGWHDLDEENTKIRKKGREWVIEMPKPRHLD